MKRLVMVVFPLLLLTIPLMAKDSGESAIRATDEAFAAAWNKHDVKAMAASFSRDGDLINPFGRMAKGRAAIEGLLQDEHAHAMKQSSYKAGAVSIRFLEPEIAFVDSDIELSGVTGPDGSVAPPMKIHLNRLLQKKDGKWLTVAARPAMYPPHPGPK